ncbi:uncharacterized protein J3D65DRAFT_633990 [Phyllosticta citribraziliensis]|uniref:Uncharacterized protein n=1 Tax=Phyllosticta citribraziliensis TaxID=989973 RepID=A0ABR1LCM2_9PEZI
MFAFGSSSSLIAGRHDPDKERADPGQPTPVRFPRLNPENQPTPKPWTSPADAPDLFRQFTHIRRPVDITANLFTSMNIELNQVHGVTDIVTALPDDASSYLPPESWKNLDAAGDASQDHRLPKRLLCNGREYPGREEFTIRLKEIMNDNYHAFSALTRTQIPEKKPPRLAHFRRFWEGLDNMAYYWDTSRDVYVPLHEQEEDADDQDGPVQTETPSKDGKASEKVKPAGENETAAEEDAGHTNNSEPRKKAKTQDSDGKTDSPRPGQAQPAKLSPPKPTRVTEVRAKLVNGKWVETKSTAPKTKYKGMRIGNGRGMPEGYRTDTVRGFIEPLSWQYGLALGPHRRPPALQIHKLRVPVRVSSAVWKSSTDRLKARQGIVQGPVAGIRCADFVEFSEDIASTAGQREALLDVIREIGSILCIAQERAREGKSERKPGEGMWWTTAPRWGGGPGGEVGEGRGDSDGPLEKAKEEKEERSSSRGSSSSSTSRRVAAKKKTAAEAWADLKPGVGYWDPKVEYEAVGKDRRSEWDDVFSFSSLNHHVALLHLHVHPAYLDFLQTGELPSPPPADPSWSRPVLRRSRWYDFFSVDDRVELFCGLWGLFGWLVRTQPPQQQDGDGDVEMKDAT